MYVYIHQCLYNSLAPAADIRQGLRKAGIDDGRGSSGGSVSTISDDSKAAYKRGSIVAVWSDEPVARSSLALTEQRYKKSYYGTISYIPA